MNENRLDGALMLFHLQYHLNKKFAVALNRAAELHGYTPPLGLVTRQGKSLLHHAVEVSDNSAVVSLLQSHPPLGLILESGAYPIVCAVRNKKLSLSTLVEMLEIVAHTREMFSSILQSLKNEVDSERMLLVRAFVPLLGSRRCLHVHICGEDYADKTTFVIG